MGYCSEMCHPHNHIELDYSIYQKPKTKNIPNKSIDKSIDKFIGKYSMLWSRKQYTHTKYNHEPSLKESILTYLVRYKEHDIRKGLYDNNLSYDWFYENIYTQPCIYCGTIDHNIGADRIDNTKGHSKENIVPSCNLCNVTRSDRFTTDEMKILGEAISKIRMMRLNLF